jgi:hypothetical protein
MNEEKKKYYEKLFKRLYSKTIEKENSNYQKPCLEYTGFKDKNGYGMITIRKNKIRESKRANRVSYAISKNISIEDIPDTNELGEKLIISNGIYCSKLCIEPTHLRITFPTLTERLYSKTIEKYNPNYEKPCLEFTGSKNSDGYGNIGIRINGKNIPKRAHRISYALSRNISIHDIPETNELGETLVVCHGNGCSRLCIEPTHLKLDTLSVNMYEDKIRDKTINNGESHYNSKITEEIALLIKHSYGEGSRKERSKKFNVSSSIVGNIDRNHSWSHLPYKDGVKKDTKKKRTAANKTLKKNKTLTFTDEDWNKLIKKLKDKSIISETIEENVSTPCHIYQGAKDDYGYGFLTFKGIGRRAHIFSYETKSKKRHEKTKQVIRHICNNRQCINTEHLQLGTRTQNAMDSMFQSKNSKLKEEQVKEIKLLLKQKTTCRDISKRYNVSETTILNIKNNVSWKNV